MTKLQQIFEDIAPCKGLVFRGSVNCFMSGDGKRIASHKELRLLKRKSCEGCYKCGWILDSIDMGVIQGIEDIENGKLYILNFVEDGRNWENGGVDEWHWEIQEIGE